MANLTTELNKDFENDITIVATKERDIINTSLKASTDTFGIHKPKVFFTNQKLTLGTYEISKYVAHHLRTIENNIERFHDIYTINWR